MKRKEVSVRPCSAIPIRDAYLVRSDVYGRKGDYRAQLRDLDAYLKLEPNGPASQRVRRGREAALRILASHPQD